MAKKYNFSMTGMRTSSFGGNETFQIEGCDSFDEAIRVVEKAIKDRSLEFDRRNAEERTRNLEEARRADSEERARNEKRGKIEGDASSKNDNSLLGGTTTRTDTVPGNPVPSPTGGNQGQHQ